MAFDGIPRFRPRYESPLHPKANPKNQKSAKMVADALRDGFT